MSDGVDPRVNKWPFLISDLILLGFAVLVVRQSPWPMPPLPLILSFLATATGSVLGILPFLRDQNSSLKLREAETLASTVAQIQDLDSIKKQISNATAQWQAVQDCSSKTVAAAKETTDRMQAELTDFRAFLQKANDAERNHLRLEVEKLRRGEAEWLQTTVHILDHVFALNRAAARSGQPGLVAQLDQFQFACRDVPRRLGLSAFVPAAGDAFDAQAHQTSETEAVPSPGGTIAEILGPGYTYQGKLVRRALVRLEPRSVSMTEASQTPVDSPKPSDPASSVNTA